MQDIIKYIESQINKNRDLSTNYKNTILADPLRNFEMLEFIFKTSYLERELSSFLRRLQAKLFSDSSEYIYLPNELIENCIAKCIDTMANYKFYIFDTYENEISNRTQLVEMDNFQILSKRWEFECIQNLYNIYNCCFDIFKKNENGRKLITSLNSDNKL